MNKNEFTITKGTVEVYKVRHPTGMYWADITIDAAGKTGRIQIASDFGDWQNYWGACGNSFKEFLSCIDIYYAADKFGADRHFDKEGTLNAFKRSVIHYRRRGDLTADHARELFDQCKALEGYTHEQEFCSELGHQDELMTFLEYCPDIQRTVTPGFKRFWENVWPVFLQELKRESEYCADCNLPYSADYKITGPFTRPTEDDLCSPVFNAIFQAIKGWKDIKVPDRYTGTLHADGKHAKLIFDAINQVVQADRWPPAKGMENKPFDTTGKWYNVKC